MFEARSLSFRCSCSRERVINMLRMLGHQEIKSILDERDAVEVNCEFCNRRYIFDPVDAEQVFAAEVVTDAAALGTSTAMRADDGRIRVDKWLWAGAPAR